MDCSTLRHSRRLFTTVTAAVIVTALIVVVVHGPLLDLHIYRMGGSELLRGGDGLYSLTDPASALPFTYPPFAAVLFAPLAAIDGFTAELLLTAASAAALARVCVLVHRAAPDRLPHPALLLGGAIVLEPVISTVCFGQINLILLCRVVEDVLGRRRRSCGVLIGLACGIKLVPGIFILLLLVVGRTRDAARAAVAVAVTMVVGVLAAPGSSLSYWTSLIFDDTRIGSAAYIGNQSISGLLARLFGPDLAPAWWLTVALMVVAAGLVTARRRHRVGDELGALAAVAVAGLLASPISWSHHWVWLVVVIPALYAGRYRRIAIAWLGLAISWCIWLVPYGGDREYDLNPPQLIVGNGYVLAAFVTLAVLARTTRPATRSPRRRNGNHSRRAEISRESSGAVT